MSATQHVSPQENHALRFAAADVPSRGHGFITVLVPALSGTVLFLPTAHSRLRGGPSWVPTGCRTLGLSHRHHGWDAVPRQDPRSSDLTGPGTHRAPQTMLRDLLASWKKTGFEVRIGGPI